MRLAYKLRKVFTGDALRSAHRHAHGLLRPPAWSAEAIIQSIDAARFAQIQAKYRPDRPTVAWPKYFDLEHWIRVNLGRVRELDLDFEPRQRILDLGCGAGYFLYICKLLGHDVLGMDVQDVPMFGAMTELLEVPRVTARIQPFQRLPDLGRKFDLITGHLVCFNNHKRKGVWGIPEWDFFLSDIASHLAPRGRLWLELNREVHGAPYSQELKTFFEKRGASVQAQRVIFHPGTLVPAAAASGAL